MPILSTLAEFLYLAPPDRTAVVLPGAGTEISYAKLREQVMTMADALAAVEARRPMELEAIAGAVIEVGERLEIPMPYTRTVYASTRLLDQISRGVPLN